MSPPVSPHFPANSQTEIPCESPPAHQSPAAPTDSPASPPKIAVETPAPHHSPASAANTPAHYLRRPVDPPPPLPPQPKPYPHPRRRSPSRPPPLQIQSSRTTAPDAHSRSATPEASSNPHSPSATLYSPYDPPAHKATRSFHLPKTFSSPATRNPISSAPASKNTPSSTRPARPALPSCNARRTPLPASAHANNAPPTPSPPPTRPHAVQQSRQAPAEALPKASAKPRMRPSLDSNLIHIRNSASASPNAVSARAVSLNWSKILLHKSVDRCPFTLIPCPSESPPTLAPLCLPARTPTQRLTRPRATKLAAPAPGSTPPSSSSLGSPPPPWPFTSNGSPWPTWVASRAANTPPATSPSPSPNISASSTAKFSSASFSFPPFSFSRIATSASFWAAASANGSPLSSRRSSRWPASSSLPFSFTPFRKLAATFLFISSSWASATASTSPALSTISPSALSPSSHSASPLSWSLPFGPPSAPAISISRAL